MRHKERFLFPLLWLATSIATPVIAQEKSSLRLGGAVRFNYNFSDWKPDNRKRGGDFGFDVFRLNVSSAFRRFTLDAEYRFYPSASGGGMLKHGWIGYTFDDRQAVEVGLARALANDPEVLLMDEAFSALDPLIRIEMQDELLALQSKMKKTIVFITHDLEEAIKLGDRIAIMRDGNVEQVGTSEEILTEPANAYIRNFVEKVERRRVITAASIMVDKPVVARLGKEGPEALIRKMKERKLTVLPVVNADGILVGEVRLGDLVELRQKQAKDITPAVREQVHSVLGDTVVDDILPLMTKTNSPIWVVNERREFEGVVPLASLIVEVTGKDKKEINEIIQNAIDL